MMRKITLNGDDWSFKEFMGMDWVWRNSVMPVHNDTRWWYPATVPGTVLHDVLMQGDMPDPYYECNSKMMEWVPARTWVYRRNFVMLPCAEGERITLCFEGIDYSAEIFLNGQRLGHHEGMYVCWHMDVTDLLLYGVENVLAVAIEPAPAEQPQVGKTSLVRTHKSRMTYWWDFCPRMIHQGIWDEVYLRVTGRAQLHDVCITSELQPDHAKAALHLVIEAGDAEKAQVRVYLNDETMPRAVQQVNGGIASIIIHIDNPRLWWPNGCGEPYEYRITVQLCAADGSVSDTRELYYGVRYIEFTSNDNTAITDPKLVLNVNGKKLYINGYNWVPIDVMYGVERPEKLHRLLRLAREAGINMFRVWGGGLIEKQSFYHACAQNGILVWQEFIQSSSGIENKTPEDADYIAMMKEQAEIIVKRKRNNTALAVWCGGNELQEVDGMPLDNTNPLLSVLMEVVHEHDPARCWLPTSPSGGVFSNSIENIEACPDRLCDVHGPWEHQGLQKHCTLYNRGTSMLHTEFGVEGMTNCNVLDKYVAKEHFLPASKDNKVFFHRGSWWTNEPLLQITFGGLHTIEDMQKASQYMQYEGLKYAVECNRRRAFHNSGSFPWQFNEPFPNNYCTSALDYHANPKPVYYGVKNAYQPLMVSARFDSPSVYGKTAFDVELYATTSLEVHELAALGDLTITAQVLDLKGRICAAQVNANCQLAANGTVLACSISVVTGDIATQLFLLHMQLRQQDRTVLCTNEYLFTKGITLAEMTRQPKTELHCVPGADKLLLQNVGENAALYFYVTDAAPLPQTDWIYFDRNYLTLLPGETVEIAVSADSGILQGKELLVRGFNCEAAAVL
jgi:beta-mannosidase